MKRNANRQNFQGIMLPHYRWHNITFNHLIFFKVLSWSLCLHLKGTPLAMFIYLPYLFSFLPPPSLLFFFLYPLLSLLFFLSLALTYFFFFGTPLVTQGVGHPKSTRYQMDVKCRMQVEMFNFSNHKVSKF